MTRQTNVLNVSRRQFLSQSAQTGAFVVGTVMLSGNAMAARTGVADTGGPAPALGAAGFQPNVFVAIAPDDNVTITCQRSEMGQQIRTSIVQIIADELEADWAKITIEQAEGDARYGDQNTDGSRSIRENFTALRRAGASARTMLEQAAAQEWKVYPSECRAINHRVIHLPTGRRFGYGELAGRAATLEVPAVEDLRLKPRSEWRYIGEPVHGVDMPKIVRGDAQYGIDFTLDDMLVAVIARPPVLFGRVKSYDATAALAVPGVEKVIELASPEPAPIFKPLGGLAVIARNSWAAIKGRDALVIEWEAGPNGAYESASYTDELQETARRPGKVVRQDGDVDKSFASAAAAEGAQKLAAEYIVPHMAQAPMEPPCATALVKDGFAEIWAPVQAPQRARGSVAGALGFDEANVRVNVTMLGGGFGRKSKPDFIVEAALLSQKTGVPIKVIWTREDDLKHSYFHVISAQRLEAALDEGGKATGWLHRSVFPTVGATFTPGAKQGLNWELSLGLIDNPFAIPHMRMENGEAEAHSRMGWLRSVNNIYHAFAVQSFAHELAVAAGRDPKDYLLELIGPPRHIDLASKGVDYVNYGADIKIHPVDTGRLANVARLAADKAGWGRKLPAGHGLGIAVHRSFLSYVATVIEVAVTPAGELSVPGIWTAIDAGTVVNIGNVRAQCQGGAIYGLSCALTSEISFAHGTVEQSNFDDYRVIRMDQAPGLIDVHVVDSEAPPGGVGEPPVPPIAPALCNAIYVATGKRIRRLPVLSHDLSYG